jgi:hypothetical protein
MCTEEQTCASLLTDGGVFLVVRCNENHAQPAGRPAVCTSLLPRAVLRGVALLRRGVRCAALARYAARRGASEGARALTLTDAKSMKMR